MNKKKYGCPQIKKISLDSEQAILQVCQISGGYLGSNGGANCWPRGTLIPLCDTAVRGGGQGSVSEPAVWANAPS